MRGPNGSPPHVPGSTQANCRGLFAGSGVIEAGCKSVAGQRLRQSAMHWTLEGADAIITLRCREASSQRETIYNTPHTRTRTA